MRKVYYIYNPKTRTYDRIYPCLLYTSDAADE